jgi:lactobin A/cerein 7B family class IIb bacteriocin
VYNGIHEAGFSKMTDEELQDVNGGGLVAALVVVGVIVVVCFAIGVYNGYQEQARK